MIHCSKTNKNARLSNNLGMVDLVTHADSVWLAQSVIGFNVHVNKGIHDGFSNGPTVQVIMEPEKIPAWCWHMQNLSHGSIYHMILQGGSYLCIETRVRILISLTHHEKYSRLLQERTSTPSLEPSWHDLT